MTSSAPTTTLSPSPVPTSAPSSRRAPPLPTAIPFSIAIALPGLLVCAVTSSEVRHAPYIVRRDGEEHGRWSCTCPSFAFSTASPATCKHIGSVRASIETAPAPRPHSFYCIDCAQVPALDGSLFCAAHQPPPRPIPQPASDDEAALENVRPFHAHRFYPGSTRIIIEGDPLADF